MRRVLLFLGLLWPGLQLSATSATQTPQVGLYEFGSFDVRGFDTINRGNLNQHFTFPIMAKPGRAGTNFNFALNYDGLVWLPTSTSGTSVWSPVANWGWTTASTAEFGYVTYSVKNQSCTLPPHNIQSVELVYSNFRYWDHYGRSHPFPYSYTTACGGGGGFPAGTGTYAVTDNSGYTIFRNGSAFTSFSRIGEQLAVQATVAFNGNPATYVPTAAGYSDTNGNEVTASSSGVFTDTLGTTVLKTSGTAPSPVTYTYTDTTGTSRAVTVNYTAYSVATNFGVSGIAEYTNTDVPLVSSIVYPDGTQYSFTYEPTPGGSGTVTGRLASVTLPTGGAISYSYTGGSHGIEADGSTSGLTRTTSDGTTTYVRSAVSSTSSTTTYTDASSNVSVYNFLESTLGYIYETSRSLYAGAASGTPLQAITTCYVSTSGCANDSVEAPINYQITNLSQNGIAIESYTNQYSNGTLVTASAGDYSQSLAYQGFTGAQGIGFSRLSSVTTFLNSVQVSSTSYGYDQTTPTATSGIPQHGTVTTSRGNMTTNSPWLNTTNAAFGATTIAYDDTGTPLSSNNFNGTTNFGYEATHSYLTALTPPTPSSGVSLPSAATYDANTGLTLTTKDPNNAEVSIPSYNSVLQPLEADTLDSSGNMVGKTTFSYSPNQQGVQTYQSASVKQDTETHLDGYGRVDRIAILNGQGTNPWYQQDTCYDVNGRVQFQSYSYQGNGFSAAKVCSGSGDTFTYDALGRTIKVAHADGTSINYSYNGRATMTTDENGVSRIAQIDDTGRIALVCEISSSTLEGVAPSSCGTDISGAGFTTTYGYATDKSKDQVTTITQGQQQRTFATDSLGRTVSVTEPERGTTTFAYSSNATGLVIVRTRPTANQTGSSTTTTTTQYDSLNRVVSITYSDGTPTKTFAYDTNAAWVWSNFSPTNLKGRLYLTEAAGTSTAATTRSYDATGRINSMHECLPSGCGNATYDKILNYSYDWAGDLLSSTDGAGVTTSYNSFTPANEVGSISTSLSGAGNPSLLVTSPVYNANGTVSFNLGNGLSQANSFDSLGRLNGGWVCVGPPSVACSNQRYGFAINWSGSRVTASSDDVIGQNNSYGYDEFNRLKSASLASGGQTFSYTYDRYGNRWQQNAPQGGPAPLYSFSATTNQSSSFSYDAAGNVTADGFHSYTYDAEGNVTKVDAGNTAINTYDASNQRVRVDLANGSQEFVFNQYGQRASIWTPAALTPVTGQFYWGAKPIAYYTAATAQTHFQHQDWLGTERVRTTYNGSTEAFYNSLPFGDSYTVNSGGTDTDAYHFASLDQDSTSNTEHAQFRQYSTTQGRWLSPDPYDGSYDASNPESFNRYGYVGENPLSYTDALGLFTQAPCSSNNPGACPPLSPLPTGPSSPNSGGGGGGTAPNKPQQPKSPAKQQCEAQAKAALNSQLGQVAANTAVGTLVGGATALGYSALKGCGVGGLAAAIFGAETGPFDIGVALGGCVAGAGEGIYAGVTDTVVTAAAGGGVGATLGAINAKHDYDARMQACAQIP